MLANVHDHRVLIINRQLNLANIASCPLVDGVMGLLRLCSPYISTSGDQVGFVPRCVGHPSVICSGVTANFCSVPKCSIVHVPFIQKFLFLPATE